MDEVESAVMGAMAPFAQMAAKQQILESANAVASFTQAATYFAARRKALDALLVNVKSVPLGSVLRKQADDLQALDQSYASAVHQAERCALYLLGQLAGALVSESPAPEVPR